MVSPASAALLPAAGLRRRVHAAAPGRAAVLVAVLVATTGGAPIAADEVDCTRLEAAHETLLRSSFSAERTVTVTLNGDLKMREVSRLTYAGGELSREVTEKEVLDDKLVLEEGEEESSLALPFACELITETDDGSYELRSADGTETVVFVLSEPQGALQPVAWRSSDKTRLLWKKLEIEARAEYRRFAWH